MDHLGVARRSNTTQPKHITIKKNHTPNSSPHAAPPPPRKALLAFLLRFAIVAAVLMSPWLGLQDAYGNMLRRAAQGIVHRDSKWVVLFKRDHHPQLDTVMFVGNRQQVLPNRQLKTARLSFTTRYVAYLPTALFAALVLATPLPWKRRLAALGSGLLLMQLFVALLLLIMILDQCVRFPNMELVQLSSFAQKAVQSLYDIFINHIGARLAVPVLLWIIVCFRRHDLDRILGAGQVAASPSPAG